MKCTNRILSLLLSVIFIFLLLSGCGKNVEFSYEEAAESSQYAITQNKSARAKSFAADLCVVSGDSITIEEIEEGPDVYASAGLFDVSGHETVYSRDMFKKLYPASLTKVMTALIVVKYCNKEDIVRCSENVEIKEDGAQLCGFKNGDTMTMDQAMHGLLMYSGNDAAVAIAETVSGSVEDFAELMNQEATIIGATSTHFVNPHGLSHEDHYTTPYDMYLMFNEAIKYEWFTEILNTPEYTFEYTKADGSVKEMTFNTTNLYLKGDRKVPEGVTVVGGKTGTTMAAGNNLILLSKNGGGEPYISIVMRMKTRDLLYKKMTTLLQNEN